MRLICTWFITLSLAASPIIEFSPGDTAIFKWRNGYAYCDGCPVLKYNPPVTFRATIIQERQLLGVLPWFDLVESFDVGTDTSIAVIIEKNTGCYVQAFRVLYSDPSDTVYAYVDIPITRPSILFRHDAIAFSTKWKFIGVHKFLDGRHCVAGSDGKASSRFPCYVETAGLYTIVLEGWRYNTGSTIISIGASQKEINFNQGIYSIDFNLQKGETEISITATGTSICLSSIYVISQDSAPPAPVMMEVLKK